MLYFRVVNYSSSCQCPCSGDHTFPGGAESGGEDKKLDFWEFKELDEEYFSGTDWSNSKKKNQNIIKTKIIAIGQKYSDLSLGRPWQDLYFLPLPQWQESFLPSLVFKIYS